MRFVIFAMTVFGLLLPGFSAQAVESPTAHDIALARGPAIGSKIPTALALTDQTGKARNFDNLKGENGLVLLFFRSARWCPYCKRQLADINAHADEITRRGFGLAALSYDSVKTLNRYSVDNEISYPLLSDHGSETIDAFGLRNEKFGKMHFAYGVPHPMIFVIAPDRTITAKLAEEGYKNRPTISAILDALDK